MTRSRAEPPFPYLRWLGSQISAGRLWTGRPVDSLGWLSVASGEEHRSVLRRGDGEGGHQVLG